MAKQKPKGAKQKPKGVKQKPREVPAEEKPKVNLAEEKAKMVTEKPQEVAAEEKPELDPLEAGIGDTPEEKPKFDPLEAGIGDAAEEKAEKDKSFYAMLAVKRRAYTQKQIDQATAWVVKKFADLIVFEGKPGKRAARLFVKRFIVEQRHRDAGLTSLPDGWEVGQSMLAEDWALAFIDPILDETIAEGDKVQAIMDLDAELGYGHAHYFERWPEMWVEFPEAADA